MIDEDISTFDHYVLFMKSKLNLNLGTNKNHILAFLSHQNQINHKEATQSYLVQLRSTFPYLRFIPLQHFLVYVPPIASKPGERIVKETQTGLRQRRLLWNSSKHYIKYLSSSFPHCVKYFFSFHFKITLTFIITAFHANQIKSLIPWDRFLILLLTCNYTTLLLQSHTSRHNKRLIKMVI